jgi:hypothetical protein
MELHGVNNLKERRSGGRGRLGGSLKHGGISRVAVTCTASCISGRSFTSRLFASKFALRLRAESRLLARPVAVGSFAHRGAVRLRRNASSFAVGWVADSFALGAVIFFAHILRATDRADRRVTLGFAVSRG